MIRLAHEINHEYIGTFIRLETGSGGVIEGTLKYLTKYAFSSKMSEVILTIGFVEFPDAAFKAYGTDIVVIERTE